MRNKFQTGQAFLEIVIALTLLTILILAIAIVTVNGLKNSQYSKNQIQGTKYAQEAIEKVRTIRDRNYSLCNTPTFSGVKKFRDDVWSISCSTATTCIYTLTTATTCGAESISDPFWLMYTPSATAEQITANGVTFNRLITILDNGTSSKEVRIRVSWKDVSGNHSSSLSTILTNY